MSSMILEVKNLWAGYSNREVIKGVDFSVNRGEFIGIIGPNGAGKSTLIRALSRVLEPSQGSVSLNGKDLHKMRLSEAALITAVVPQDTLIVFEFLVRDIVSLGRIPHIRKLGKETQEDLDIVEDCLGLTKTKELADRFINELSAGERQRAIIAKALAQEPQLLMLDEPTSHLDISHQTEIFDLIKSLSRDKGLTVIAVLHDLNLASEYCDRLILMSEGKIFRQGRPEQVLDYKTIEAVYKTVVVVGKNPVSGKPSVFPVPEGQRRQ
ncbi:MAG: heme ABC transporter ATP-binding protein [Candidatus Omnitrophica bacterium]|nr:heme ABC transporter ATP-binding protein [Candidatus Omnitrophota bacterium]